MIRIENVYTCGWEQAIMGMRNPLNSWAKSDTTFFSSGPFIGPNDLDLMRKLIRSGPEHRKFLRFIHVAMDITAPIYWWKEYDTYKIGTACNSCSTMHTLHKRDLTLDDFSDDWLGFEGVQCLMSVIEQINKFRQKYVAEENAALKKGYWYQMVQLLPTSFNQLRTVDLNYEVALNIIHQRTGHKLVEWHDMVNSLRALPHMEDFLNES